MSPQSLLFVHHYNFLYFSSMIKGRFHIIKEGRLPESIPIRPSDWHSLEIDSQGRVGLQISESVLSSSHICVAVHKSIEFMLELRKLLF